jgi:hypothetical protein
MPTDIFAPIIGEPTANQHDGVGRETTRSEVSSASCSDGLTGGVVGEVRSQPVEKPCTGRNATILTEPKLRAIGKERIP